MNQVRIIAGKYGGRLIKTPSGFKTHPMGDRERGAIFNSIQHDVPNTVVLDAFAGSGAVGLEALSRGALHTTFLEKDRDALRILSENIKKLSAQEQSIITKHPNGFTQKFDIIFADPPYDRPQYALIIRLLGFLKPNGIFVLSHPENAQPPKFTNLILLSDKTYAAANIKIYQNIV